MSSLAQDLGPGPGLETMALSPSYNMTSTSMDLAGPSSLRHLIRPTATPQYPFDRDDVAANEPFIGDRQSSFAAFRDGDHLAAVGVMSEDHIHVSRRWMDEEARALGGTNAGVIAAVSSATSVTSSATTSFSDLFPTATQSSDSSDSSRGTNVYYLVFLGVLVILLCVAACLTYRAFRIRRRYRTATQRAIASGGRLPPGLDDRDDLWGLGGFAGFTSDGIDRFALGGGGAVLGTARNTWLRIPKLWEHAVEPEKASDQAEGNRENPFEEGSRMKRHNGAQWDRDQSASSEWRNTQPLALQSLLPVDEDPDPDAYDPHHHRHPWQHSPNRTTSPRPRLSPRFSRTGFSFGHRRGRAGLHEPEERVEEEKVAEIDRELEDGEELRMGVIIQMPVEEGLGKPQRPSWMDDDDEMEETGWNPGMEIGVWEGVVRRSARR